MKVRDALTRAVRTFAAAFVGLVALQGIPVFDSLDEVKGAGIQYGFAAIGALFAAVVTFVNAFAEDNTRYQLPK